jgi:hypothetical protein
MILPAHYARNVASLPELEMQRSQTAIICIGLRPSGLNKSISEDRATRAACEKAGQRLRPSFDIRPSVPNRLKAIFIDVTQRGLFGRVATLEYVAALRDKRTIPQLIAEGITILAGVIIHDTHRLFANQSRSAA